MTPLLTVKECAKELRCCEKHVRDLIKRGTIVAYRDSRRFLIGETSFNLYLDQRRVSASHLSPPGTI
jgi:excisionase family DNA binding protein